MVEQREEYEGRGEEEGALGWLTFPHVWTVCLAGVSAARSVRLFVHLVAWESAESSLVILAPFYASLPRTVSLPYLSLSLVTVSIWCSYLSVCLSVRLPVSPHLRPRPARPSALFVKEKQLNASLPVKSESKRKQ